MPLQTYNQYFGVPQQVDLPNALMGAAQVQGVRQQNAMQQMKMEQAQRLQNALASGASPEDIGRIDPAAAIQSAAVQEWTAEEKQKVLGVIYQGLAGLDLQADDATFKAQLQTVAPAIAADLDAQFGERALPAVGMFASVAEDANDPAKLPLIRQLAQAAQQRYQASLPAYKSKSFEEQLMLNQSKSWGDLVNVQQGMENVTYQRGLGGMTEVGRGPKFNPRPGGESASQEDIERLADMVIEGKLAPRSMPKRGSTWSSVMLAAARKLPTFNSTYADSNYAWFNSARATASINMIQGSLPRVLQMEAQIEELPNTAFTDWNAFKRAVMTHLGYPDYSGFEANRNAIIQEVNTALSGSAQQSDTRVKLELDNLKSSRSPAQLRAAAKNLKAALLARMDSAIEGPFPLPVVRGEMSINEWKKRIYKRYKEDYSDHSLDEGTGKVDATERPLLAERQKQLYQQFVKDGVSRDKIAEKMNEQLAEEGYY